MLCWPLRFVFVLCIRSVSAAVLQSASAHLVFALAFLVAMVCARVVCDVTFRSRFAQTIHSNLPSIMEKIPTAFSETDSAPRRIVWELTPDLHHSIRRAEAQFSDLISKVGIVATPRGCRVCAAVMLCVSASMSTSRAP